MCPHARTRSPTKNHHQKEEEEDVELEKQTAYPPVLVQLLTGKPFQPAVQTREREQSESTIKGPPRYHGLIEQMTPQEVASLTSLSKICYDLNTPIAANIHGPLNIFKLVFVPFIYSDLELD